MVNFYVKVIAHKLEFESSHKAESIKGVREVTGGPAPSQTESLEHQANPPFNIKRVRSLRRNLWNIRSDLSAEKIPIHSRSMSDKSISMRHPQSTVKQIGSSKRKVFSQGKREWVRNGCICVGWSDQIRFFVLMIQRGVLVTTTTLDVWKAWWCLRQHGQRSSHSRSWLGFWSALPSFVLPAESCEPRLMCQYSTSS